MIGTQRLLPDRQRPLVQRLGVGVTALILVEDGQIVQDCRYVGMVGAERLLLDRQRPLVQRLGLRITALTPGTSRPDCSGFRDSGWSGPSTFSRIASDRLSSGSASA